MNAMTWNWRCSNRCTKIYQNQ